MDRIDRGTLFLLSHKTWGHPLKRSVGRLSTEERKYILTQPVINLRNSLPQDVLETFERNIGQISGGKVHLKLQARMEMCNFLVLETGCLYTSGAWEGSGAQVSCLATPRGFWWTTVRSTELAFGLIFSISVSSPGPHPHSNRGPRSRDAGTSRGRRDTVSSLSIAKRACWDQCRYWDTLGWVVDMGGHLFLINKD